MPKVTTIPPRKQRNHAVTSQKTRKIRVAAYCRVSTDKEDQRNSLAAQQAFFLRYIEEHPGWVLVGVFADLCR